MIYRSVLDAPSLVRYCRALAGRAGLRVEFTKETMPHTDGKTIWIPMPSLSWDEDDGTKTVGLAIHEVSHVMHSSFAIFDEMGLNKGELITIMTNGVEDHRIEWLPAKEYPGDAIVLNKLVDINIREMRKQWSEARGKKIREILASFFAWEFLNRSELFPSGVNFCEFLDTPESQAYFKRYEKFPELLDKLRELREVTDIKGSVLSYELAKEILEKVYEEKVEPPEERKKKGKGTKGEGEKSKGADGKGSEGGDRNEEGPDAKPEKGDGIEDREWVEQLVPNNHPNLSGRGININYRNYDRHGQNYIPSIVKVTDYRKGGKRDVKR